MPKFVIKDEYHDQKLGRHVGIGEELELSADRVNALKNIGVRVEPIRGQPVETATTETSEKAMNGGGKRGQGSEGA